MHLRKNIHKPMDGQQAKSMAECYGKKVKVQGNAGRSTE